MLRMTATRARPTVAALWFYCGVAAIMKLALAARSTQEFPMHNMVLVVLTLLFLPLPHAGENWPEVRGHAVDGHRHGHGIALP